MAQLALKAVSLGAEKIPDQVFHAVPGGYFRPPEVEEERKKKREKKKKDKLSRKQERKQGGRESPSSSSSNTASEDDNQPDYSRDPDKKPHRRRPRPSRARGSSYIDREYESDRGPTPAEDWQYFPPPPTRAVDESPEYYYQSIKPYNPADYAAKPDQRRSGDAEYTPEFEPYEPATYQDPWRDESTDKQAKEEKSHVASRSVSTQPEGVHTYQPPEYDPVFPNSPRGSPAPRSRERHANPPSGGGPGSGHYTPNKYIPSAYNPPQASTYPQGVYSAASPVQAPTVFPPPATQPPLRTAEPTAAAASTAIAPYQPPVASPSPAAQQLVYPPSPVPYARHPPPIAYSPRPPSPTQSPPGSRERSRHQGNRSRRGSGLREQLREHRDLGAAALGAVAGGLVARQMGHGSGLSTLVGAAVGGIGGTFAEKRFEEERRHRHKRRGDYVGRDRYSDDGYDSY